MDFYGAECIFVRPNVYKRVETAFNTVLRRCFHLHYRTHVNILCSLVNLERIQHVLLRRSISLITRFSRCNSLTEYLYKFFLHDTHSYIGNNLWTARYLLANAPLDAPSPFQSLINEIIDCLTFDLAFRGMN